METPHLGLLFVNGRKIRVEFWTASRGLVFQTTEHQQGDNQVKVGVGVGSEAMCKRPHGYQGPVPAGTENTHSPLVVFVKFIIMTAIILPQASPFII